MNFQNAQRCLFPVVCAAILTGNVLAKGMQSVTLASVEQLPYIGESLPDKGYVHEVVGEAFRRAGYDVTIKFYPLARAKHEAEAGVVDGWTPAYVDDELKARFLFSAPFPGDSIGLLKKKSLKVGYVYDPNKNVTEILAALAPYRFGLVREARALPEVDQSSLFEKDYAGSDLENLSKLGGDRINFIVIDKYTAADLMVSKRPHLIGQLEFLSPPLRSNSFQVAFSRAAKGYQQRAQDFNAGLQSLIADGTLAAIQARHGLLPPTLAPTDKVKLTIATVNNSDMIVMKGLSDQFEKAYPKIKLDWRVMEENSLRQRLLSDLAIADGQFDIMTIGTYEAPIWAKRGWLTPLKNLPASYEVSDLLSSVRDGLSYQGTLYALPFYAESSMTYYRKDLFQKAGLSMPAQPSYADIKRFAAALHDPAHKTYGICLRGKAGWGENMAILGTMVNTFGGRWFDEQWHPAINSPEWKEAVTTYKELLTQYGPPQVGGNGFNESLSLFSDGQCGIWIDATVAASMVSNPKQSKVYDKVGFAPAPIAVTPKGSYWLWSWALAIPDSSTHKAEALQFITWATSREYIQKVAQKEGWVAVPPGTRKSTYANTSYQAAAPFADFVLKAIQSANPIDSTLKPKPYIGIQFAGIPEFPAIGGQVGAIMNSVLTDKISIDKALRDAQEMAEQQMRLSGYFK